MAAPKKEKEDEKAVPVTAETDAKKKKGAEDDKKKAKSKKGSSTSDDFEMKEDAMSEEDKELKQRLEECVSTVLNSANEASVTIPIRLTALDVIVNELRTATSSMTSVPKPLKFLRPHFTTLKSLFVSLEDKEGGTATKEKDPLEFRARLADVLAVLAMTMGKPGEFAKKLKRHFIHSLLQYNNSIVHVQPFDVIFLF
jgi:26S proteasome regulatory subunit N1